MGNGILSRANSGDGAKIGTIRLSARDSLGEKWALCNGDPVTGGGDDTLEIRYHWKPLDVDNLYFRKGSETTDGFTCSSMVYDEINNEYYRAELFCPSSSSINEGYDSLTITKISGDKTVTVLLEDWYNKSYNGSYKIDSSPDRCVIQILYDRSRNYIHVGHCRDVFSTKSSSLTSGFRTFDINDNMSRIYTRSSFGVGISNDFPSYIYTTGTFPLPNYDAIVNLNGLTTSTVYYADDGDLMISFYVFYDYEEYGFSRANSIHFYPLSGRASDSTIEDCGLYGYARSKDCTLVLPTFILTDIYATYGIVLSDLSATDDDVYSSTSLPYVSNNVDNIKCRSLITPSCIDYENNIFYCVGYDGGIYKISVTIDETQTTVAKDINTELINSTWINYAQHINFEFAAIKFHTQYKADGTKQLYMFIVGEEGSYVAPINDITTFGPDAVFTEIPNLQAKDVLTGNVLTDAAFVNRLLIINDKNNNDIMFYEQSLPEIDKPGVNGFIKIKN